jgi:hypothetical protein
MLEELKRLSAEAIAEPWIFEEGADGRCIIRTDTGMWMNCGISPKSSKLVVLMRNNIDKLIAVAEAARAFMKVREHHGLCALRIGDGDCDCGYDALQKALKELA